MDFLSHNWPGGCLCGQQNRSLMKLSAMNLFSDILQGCRILLGVCGLKLWIISSKWERHTLYCAGLTRVVSCNLLYRFSTAGRFS